MRCLIGSQYIPLKTHLFKLAFPLEFSPILSIGLPTQIWFLFFLYFQPYRMIPGIGHRAFEVCYYYYYIMMVTGPQLVELTLVKCWKLFCSLGLKSNPSIAWKKANVFKRNGDDVYTVRYIIIREYERVACRVCMNLPSSQPANLHRLCIKKTVYYHKAVCFDAV